MKNIFKLLIAGIAVLTLAGCKNQKSDDYKLKIVAPGGAPAVAISDLKVNATDKYDITIGLEATALAPMYANKENDVIIAPINQGASQFAANGNYKLAAALTWGNLYFASQKVDFKLEDMNAADVVFFGENTINDVVVKYVLAQNNITPSKIEYLGSTQLTQAELLGSTSKIVLVAEPALSAAKKQQSAINAISVQDLYKTATGGKEFPQAGCFINTDTIKNHKSVVNEFLTDLKASATQKLDTMAANAVSLKLIPALPVAMTAIPNSNIKYVAAKDCKEALEFACSLKPAAFGGSISEEFYL